MISKKIFVLDTSVFCHNSEAILDFKNSEVLLPITVLEELDKVKKLKDDSGRNARVAIRNIYKMFTLGDIEKGIKLKDNITLRTDISAYGSIGSDPTYGDAKILACTVKAQKENPNAKVILISKDINLLVRAMMLGIHSEDYEKDKNLSSELYTGCISVNDPSAGIKLSEIGYISYDELSIANLQPNQYVLFTDGEKGIATGKVLNDKIILVKDRIPWGLRPRNKEQLFAMDLICNTKIPLVSITGAAGSGKTLISLAAALELVIEKRQYDKLIVYRPVIPVDDGIGFLPGILEEKLAPWMQPVMDAFEILFKGNNPDKWKITFSMYKEKGMIEFDAISFIRGRSINDAIILIDESQNISPEEMKTILTRVGMNSKIILTGDISQIDNKYLDAVNNGLTYAIEKFKSEELAGHITLIKGERSALATKAAEIL